MKIIDILTPEEIEAANKGNIKILENQLKATTVSDLKTLYSCITFKIQDSETDGHPAAHVLNELHLRTNTMDFYHDAATIDEAIAMRKKEKQKMMAE